MDPEVVKYIEILIKNRLDTIFLNLNINSELQQKILDENNKLKETCLEYNNVKTTKNKYILPN